MRRMKLSVIIPVYNAERYIEKCCESLFSQTLDSIEYIFVNDGSKDNGISLIKGAVSRYPNRVKYVKIINRSDNRGVAYTRQEGLNHATGEYVIHCDADDWVERDMYETLINEGNKQDADIVCCEYQIDDGHNHRVVKAPSDYKVTFNLSPIYGSLCNKAIRASLINNHKIAFPKIINWGEDFLFSTQCQVFANKIAVVNRPMYHYCQNSSSITHSISQERMEELLLCGLAMEEFLKDRGLLGQFSYHLDYLKFQLKQRLLRDSQLRNLKKWEETYPECHKSIDSFPVASYLKKASKLIIHGHRWSAMIILKSYDFYKRLKL